MKIEDILEKYFSEALTEDVKTEIETIFEAAVNTKVKEKLEEDTVALNEKYDNEMKEFKESVLNTLNDYIEESFNEWAEENKVALSSEIKVDIADNMVKSLRSVLDENYIEIKEEEIDTIKDLETRLKESENKIDDLGNVNINQKKQILEFEKAIVFSQMTEGMTLTDKEALLKIVEDIEAKDIKTFKEKVEIIKNKFTIIDEKEELGDEDPDKKIDTTDDKQINESQVDKYLPKAFI